MAKRTGAHRPFGQGWGTGDVTEISGAGTSGAGQAGAGTATATATAPLWAVTANEVDPASHPLPSAAVDVAIVGGGYTGLATAYYCARAGLSAHVLEAERIGAGGSGRNVGLVNAAAWLPPDRVQKTLGPVYGPRFLERFGNGPSVVFDLIEQHQIRCEARRGGTIHAAHAPSGLADLRARHAAWQRLGAPVDLLDREAVAELTGSAAFHGGLLDRRAGTINPMGYVRGLARAAVGAGAGLTTGARVTMLRRNGTLWRLDSTAGRLEARAVVLGTNAYTDALWPGLSSVFSTIDYLQVSTGPLPEARQVLPGGQGLWTTAPVMVSLRREAAGRVMIGTMGRVLGDLRAGLTRRWAARELSRLYPDLGPVAFESAWHGRIAMTPDHLPRVLKLDEGLWTPIGYNGRGIATGTLFGQAMAGLLSGDDPGNLPLPVSAPARVPLAGLRSRVLDLAFSAHQVWKGF